MAKSAQAYPSRDDFELPTGINMAQETTTSPTEENFTATKSTDRIPADVDVIDLIETAKEQLYHDPNIVGVGIGPRRRDDEIEHDEITLIVYVKEKLPEDAVKTDNLVPEEIDGIPTDVVAPFGPDAPREALGVIEGHHHADDMGFIDWARLHEQWLEDDNLAVDADLSTLEVSFGGTVEDFGDVCVIEDDGTLVRTINGQQTVDWVRAYKLFRTKHDDIYDFVTFFTDSDHGMPPQGGSSWYSFVHNDIQGIGLGTFSSRSTYGSNKLQGIMFLNQGHIPVWRYVMLQEQGHRWGAFARYKDAASGSVQNDHMLNGWGHWAFPFDDDKSPMDYDIYDWVATNGEFERISLTSEERTYSNLDLYLMGLLAPDEVGDFNLLTNLSPISGNRYTATKKQLSVENVVFAEGTRVPSASSAQNVFKNAFIVLTGNMDEVHDLADRVDSLRLRFEHDFYQATKTLGRVDTTLGPLRAELTSAQVKALTSGGYTDLHRHAVRPWDLRITGTQYRGTLDSGQTQRVFTHSWPSTYVVNWVARPTTAGGRVESSLMIERASNGTFTYWITVKNVGSVRTDYELEYELAR